MIFENAETRTKQGDIGEARAIYEYTKLGYSVSRTIFDSTKYDLIVDDGESLKRVQVKTSQCLVKPYGKSRGSRSGYTVQLASMGGNRKINTRRNRDEDDYDILFVLLGNDECYSIPTEALKGAKTSINVGTSRANAKYTKYKL